MSLSPFFSYFGAKWRLAPRYPKPLHDTIIEPFAGAAGYATRHHRHRVILVEKDATIAGIWRYLLTAREADVMRLPELERGQSVADLPISEAERALIGMWVQMGTGQPRLTRSSWADDEHDPQSPKFWGRGAKARIASQLAKIRHWQLIEGTYADAPDVEATWFIDPPYEVMGNHQYGPRCQASDVDFAALGSWCRRRRGQVMVCENEGATWLPFKPFTAQRGSHKDSTEAIWRNDC